MEKSRSVWIWLLIVSAAAVGAEPAAKPDKSVMVMFQDAQYQEQTAGDLDKAIELYQKVVEEAGEVEKLAARATFQLGMCYLKKDDKAKAIEYFTKVVKQYPAQKELAKRATSELDRMGVKNTEQTEDSSFIAKLINGVTLELVGLCRYTEGGIECFRPDGSILERQLSISKWNKAPKASDIGIMLRIDGPEDVELSYKSIEGAKGWEGSCQVNEDGKTIKGWQAALAKFDDGCTTTNLVFGIAEGPWTTVAEHDGKTMEIINGITFTRAIETARWVEISASDTLGSTVEQRIAVIDKNGNLIPWQGTRGSVSNDKLRQSSGGFEGIKLDQIQKFVFQTRPYQWVNFKNISLRAGIQTKAEVYINNVKVESRAASKADRLLAEDLIAEGWKLWRERKLVEAEKKFEEAVAADPTNDGAYQGLGWAQLNQGKKNNAKASFEKCVELNPQNSAALNGLGWIAHGQNDKDQAIQWWEKAVTAQPGATASLSGLTQVYMEREDYQNAIKYYKMWLKAEPDNQEAKEGLDKAAPLRAEQEKRIQKAVDAAKGWLEMLDKGQYDESWNNAASLFKKAVTKGQWKTSAETVRNPLGDLISREMLSQNYTRQVPGGPDGEYVIIQFKASFANKKDAIETVTPMLDSDGQWRVSGYFIK